MTDLATLRRWRDDPAAFAREYLRVELTEEQARVMETIRDSDATVVLPARRPGFRTARKLFLRYSQLCRQLEEAPDA